MNPLGRAAGTPTYEDLTTEVDGVVGAVYWQGMQAFADAGPHVYIKISMLCYTDPKWNENAVVAAAVGRLIKLFGSNRCFFASNYPVDMLPDQGGWTRAPPCSHLLCLERSHPYGLLSSVWR